MKQVQVQQVLLFEPKLCQNGATASRILPECLPGPPGAPGAPRAPPGRGSRGGLFLHVFQFFGCFRGPEAFQRVPGGRGYLLTKYEPKWTHLDLIHAIFDDFP